jgi:hypothetical protein
MNQCENQSSIKLWFDRLLTIIGEEARRFIEWRMVESGVGREVGREKMERRRAE